MHATSPAGSSFAEASRIATLAVATFGSFMAPFDGSVVNLALPSLGRDLGGNIVLLGWVLATYVIALTIFLVPFGRLADLRGRRLVYVLGVSTFTLTSAACGLAPSLLSLIVTRFLQGVGAAMMAGNSIALLTSIFPPSERGKALGINSAAVYIGLSSGPSLGGFLIQSWGWRSVFFVNVPLGIAVVLVTVLKIRGERVARKKESFDPIGAATYGSALSLILLSLTFSEARNPSFPSVPLMLAGLAALALFILFEARTTSPLLEVRLFVRNPPFAFSTLTALLNYSAVFGVSFVMSLYLQLALGLEAQHAGLILLAQPLTMAIFSPLGGWLSDRIEPRVISSAGMALTALSILTLSLLDTTSASLDIALRLVFLGLGLAFFTSPNTNAVMSSVDSSRYGVAAGILGTVRSSGQAISLAIVIAVLSAQLGAVPSPQLGLPVAVGPFLTGMKLAFTILAAISAAGVATSLVRGRIRNSSPGS